MSVISRSTSLAGRPFAGRPAVTCFILMMSVVTGASAGVGRAAALELGRRGDRVALLARGRRGLDAAARQIESSGGTALTHEVDVSDFVGAKRRAIACHRSQATDTGFFLEMGEQQFAVAFGREWFTERGVAPGLRKGWLFDPA